MNDGVDRPHFSMGGHRLRCKNVKMDKKQKAEMSAVRGAGGGTTHAEPRRAARLIGSATPSLAGVPLAARCSR